VAILTANEQKFYMHFNSSRIRIFQQYKDESTYMFDFEEGWFSKFNSPLAVAEN